jgi:sugar phosphate isomerase/epimerase
MHLGFTEALAKAASLGVQAIEIGTGNFSPAPHCDLNRLLSSRRRATVSGAIHSCNLELAALNCSGNPLHPNGDLASHRGGHHAQDASVWQECSGAARVCMSGCPGTPEGGGYPELGRDEMVERVQKLLSGNGVNGSFPFGVKWPT